MHVSVVEGADYVGLAAHHEGDGLDIMCDLSPVALVPDWISCPVHHSRLCKLGWAWHTCAASAVQDSCRTAFLQAWRPLTARCTPWQSIHAQVSVSMAGPVANGPYAQAWITAILNACMHTCLLWHGSDNRAGQTHTCIADHVRVAVSMHLLGQDCAQALGGHLEEALEDVPLAARRANLRHSTLRTEQPIQTRSTCRRLSRPSLPL